MQGKDKKSRWDFLGKKLKKEEDLKEKFGQVIQGKPSITLEEPKVEKEIEEGSILYEKFCEKVSEKEISGVKEEKVEEVKKELLPFMKWFQMSYLRMYFGLTFIWCYSLSLFLAVSLMGLSIGEVVFVSLFYGISATLYMLIISTGPVARWDERLRKRLVEGILPDWVAWIRLMFIVLPYWVYGWVPQKAFEWYFYKFLNLYRGLHLTEERKYWKAITELEQYKPSKSDVKENYLLHSALGECYMEIGELQKGLTAFQQATKFVPDDLPAQLNLALAYILNNRHNEGLALLRKLRQISPENIDILMVMARSYLILRMYDEAFDILKEACSLKPMDPLIHKMLAEAYLGKGLKEEAVNSANKALSLNPFKEIAEDAQEIINLCVE